jgi:hypothetical protein
LAVSGSVVREGVHGKWRSGSPGKGGLRARKCASRREPLRERVEPFDRAEVNGDRRRPQVGIGQVQLDRCEFRKI